MNKNKDNDNEPEKKKEKKGKKNVKKEKEKQEGDEEERKKKTTKTKRTNIFAWLSVFCSLVQDLKESLKMRRRRPCSFRACVKKSAVTSDYCHIMMLLRQRA